LEVNIPRKSISYLKGNPTDGTFKVPARSMGLDEPALAATPKICYVQRRDRVNEKVSMAVCW
jgi:hypothetical protein